MNAQTLLTAAKYIGIPLTLLAVGFGGAWYVQDLRIKQIQAAAVQQQAVAVTAATAKAVEQCKSSQKVTQDVETKYQGIIAGYQQQLSDRLRQPAKCVPVNVPAACPTIGADAAIIRYPVHGTGISSDALYTAAAAGKSCNAIVQGWREFYGKVQEQNEGAK